MSSRSDSHWSTRQIAKRFRASIHPADEANVDNGCPNGPDDDGNWPCDPKGYFGVLECQVCGRIGIVVDQGWPGQHDSLGRALDKSLDALHNAGYATMADEQEQG